MSETTGQQLLIVTGMSGAGLSTAANALEDLGWYVVENLPPQLIGSLLELRGSAEGMSRIAVVVDVRGGSKADALLAVLRALRSDPSVSVLFLEATDEVLVQRFEQVRRPHPLQGEGTLVDGIEAERIRLRALRAITGAVIDTSALNVHQLGTRIAEQFQEQDAPMARVRVVSFGFKYGIPVDADIVLDARFLPNPYWEPQLRALTGLDPAVAEFVLGQDGALEFIDRVAALLEPVLAGYRRENKRHATVAIGCTGGKHRSVALVERLVAAMAPWDGIAVAAKHRDLGRE